MMEKEIKILKSKLRYLEDKNFILETKFRVYESIIKHLLLSLNLLQYLIFLVNDSKKEVEKIFEFYENYLDIPSKIISFLEQTIEEYDLHLLNNRKFNDNDYSPYKFYNKSLNEFNNDIRKFKETFTLVAISVFNKNKYPIFFLKDLSYLLYKHNVNISVEEFVNSLESAKFLMKLLHSILSRFPTYFLNLDVKNLDKTFESIFRLVEQKFEDFCIVVFEDNKFVPNLDIYVNSILEVFINNLNDKILFKNTIIELMNHKSFSYEKNSSLIDQKVFNKFSHIMLPYNNNYDKPKLKFNIEYSDLVDFSNFLNICFSISDYETECESFVNNYLVENILLKKFLKCAIEQIGIDKDIDVINPIKALVDSSRKRNL